MGRCLPTRRAWEKLQRPPADNHVPVGRDNIDVIGLNRRLALHLHDRHFRRSGEDFRQGARVRGQVLHQDERHAGSVGAPPRSSRANASSPPAEAPTPTMGNGEHSARLPGSSAGSSAKMTGASSGWKEAAASPLPRRIGGQLFWSSCYSASSPIPPGSAPGSAAGVWVGPRKEAGVAMQMLGYYRLHCFK